VVQGFRVQGVQGFRRFRGFRGSGVQGVQGFRRFRGVHGSRFIRSTLNAHLLEELSEPDGP
jgi:hypothetical protein